MVLLGGSEWGMLVATVCFWSQCECALIAQAGAVSAAWALCSGEGGHSLRPAVEVKRKWEGSYRGLLWLSIAM